MRRSERRVNLDGPLKSPERLHPPIQDGQQESNLILNARGVLVRLLIQRQRPRRIAARL
jgi:hypothetical protein